MNQYTIPMVPGPVRVPQAILDAYQKNYGSADLETEFLLLYDKAEKNLQRIMGTRHKMVLQSGEGMLALWSALKSCILPGDRVLAVATGLFGDGIGDMASLLGAEVKKVQVPYDQTISDITEIEQSIVDFNPKMITAVHCETPSGTLNPVGSIGLLKKKHRVPLFYIDAVSSIGGAPVQTDAWQIDLCLGGSQKCLSSLPDISFLSVSDAAWEIIEQVDYSGYDALKPFRTAQENAFFPYTPNWHGIAGLTVGAEMILTEGLDRCYARHERVADYCRNGLTKMGLSLFPATDAIPSPTVTAAKVPERISWNEFNARLRAKGLAVGGNYGPLAEKVFRLGHMGSQADETLVGQALEVIAKVIEDLS